MIHPMKNGILKKNRKIAMLLAMHANKMPKHGGSVFGRQKLWREMIEGHNKLMRSYFVENPTYPERYFAV